MKAKVILFVLITLSFSCQDRSSSMSSNSSGDNVYKRSAPKTRIDGIKYFYNNFDEFVINLGGNYGSHAIKSVTLNGNYMTVSYDYKNGVLKGYIEPNGSYTGNYSTSSTSGKFYLRFRPDGTAHGSWNSEGGFLTFSGSLDFEKL